jgi:hypothetical protein
MLSSIVVVHKGRKVIGVDDLIMGFCYVAFEGLVLNWYDAFACITKKIMNDLGYIYLYCELLDWIGLTMITLWVKSPHIQMHGNVRQP